MWYQNLATLTLRKRTRVAEHTCNILISTCISNRVFYIRNNYARCINFKNVEFKSTPTLPRNSWKLNFIFERGQKFISLGTCTQVFIKVLVKTVHFNIYPLVLRSIYEKKFKRKGYIIVMTLCALSRIFLPFFFRFTTNYLLSNF